jgi:ketosteroid isomerase-like protein
MAACYSDTAEFLDPSFGTEYVKKTRAETAAKYAELQQMLPDIHDEIVDITASGDKVVVQFVSTGSAQGTDGKKETFTLPICSVLTIKGGKIIKDATYYDNQQ